MELEIWIFVMVFLFILCFVASYFNLKDDEEPKTNEKIYDVKSSGLYYSKNFNDKFYIG
jgi:hypothetical protein